MRSLLSQFQTPTVTSQRHRFFRVCRFNRSPRRTDHPAYFEPATFSFAGPFRPSTNAILIQRLQLSMPKIGANGDYLQYGNCVVHVTENKHVLVSAPGYPTSIYILFTEAQSKSVSWGTTHRPPTGPT